MIDLCQDIESLNDFGVFISPALLEFQAAVWCALLGLLLEFARFLRDSLDLQESAFRGALQLHSFPGSNSLW